MEFTVGPSRWRCHLCLNIVYGLKIQLPVSQDIESRSPYDDPNKTTYEGNTDKTSSRIKKIVCEKSPASYYVDNLDVKESTLVSNTYKKFSKPQPQSSKLRISPLKDRGRPVMVKLVQ